MYKSLPRDALLTIYQSFIKPHLDYCDVVYDQAESHLFIDKLEQVQYNAALAFIWGIKCTSHNKLYKELHLESFESRGRLRRLCALYKIGSNGFLAYWCKLIHLINT